jgi:hypothetical protein
MSFGRKNMKSGKRKGGKCKSKMKKGKEKKKWSVKGLKGKIHKKREEKAKKPRQQSKSDML